MVRVGCAGWTIPRDSQPRFAAGASSLERYAAVFAAAEINSSFHRPHRATTYARWAASVPQGFRFSVKLARTISHGAKLVDVEPLLDEFLEPVRSLGDAFGCLLVQLPPKLEFDAPTAARFFTALGKRAVPAIAVEPRHASWFSAEADRLLQRRRVARVVADPVRAAGGESPGGWDGFAYYRLHGTPRTYYSSYDDAFLADLAAAIRQRGKPAWCIFDNTAGSAAVPNALRLIDLLKQTGDAADG